MAGSYRHVTKANGELRKPEKVNSMLENGGDVFEAVEEMYGMIWYLADGDPDKVASAQLFYKLGLEKSPTKGRL